MIHHLSIGVTDIGRATRFYDAALRPLGLLRVWSDLRAGGTGQGVGYGIRGGGDQWALKQVDAGTPVAMPGCHVAFAAASHDAVRQFHAAALAAGGVDNGAPGLRAHYGPAYFAAFVVDPEGHHLEAVCKAAPTAPLAAAAGQPVSTDGATVAALAFTVHDSHPPDETSIVDAGLGVSNDAAAPLQEVQPLACFARSGAGQVIGGAVGRRWGSCGELQQLWVAPPYRRNGIGAQLVRQFEAHAVQRGCTSVYLETFSFQAPALYRALGYAVEFQRTGYPHGITKFHLVKQVTMAGMDADPRPVQTPAGP